MDSSTFGDSLAAIVLADKVSNDKNSRRKVTNILKGYNLEIKAINHVETRFRISIGELIYKKYREKCITLPIPISTYTDNVLSTNFKIWLTFREAELKRKKQINK
jgi:hypothetical protein